ncbi:MAG TPA: hypothetical protein PLZ86_06930 [bacterium]|nr:hypothetical protein [bacterium]
MKDSYLAFFDELDDAFRKQFGTRTLVLNIIGYTALALAGLPDRGTKDVDALKTEALADAAMGDVLAFLIREFGKGSPGALRNGMYLDFVERQIPWLPPRPVYGEERKLQRITFMALHPADVCVSKTFANFKGKHDRGNDRRDVLDALDKGIVAVADYIKRMDDTFPHYEADAAAPETFERVLRFIEREVLPIYGDEKLKLTYELPNWMINY